MGGAGGLPHHSEQASVYCQPIGNRHAAHTAAVKKKMQPLEPDTELFCCWLASDTSISSCDPLTPQLAQTNHRSGCWDHK